MEKDRITGSKKDQTRKPPCVIRNAQDSVKIKVSIKGIAGNRTFGEPES